MGDAEPQPLKTCDALDFGAAVPPRICSRKGLFYSSSSWDVLNESLPPPVLHPQSEMCDSSQGVSEYGWKSDWANRWALIRSHS